MRLIDRRHRAMDALHNVRRMASQWPERWRSAVAALEKLPLNPDPDLVDQIMGFGFTLPFCDECEERHEVVLLIGDDPPQYDSTTAHICPDCLRNAVALIPDTRGGK